MPRTGRTTSYMPIARPHPGMQSDRAIALAVFYDERCSATLIRFHEIPTRHIVEAHRSAPTSERLRARAVPSVAKIYRRPSFPSALFQGELTNG